MASVPVEKVGGVRTSGLLLSCVTEHGSASHPYIGSHELLKGSYASRNLADAVHFLTILHGRHPGVVDNAANRSIDPLSRAWFTRAMDGFATERLLLSKLTVAAGPLPSTPGASDNDAVVRAQRHAVDMLAQSERNGCALGAAMALILDWVAIRRVLDVAAVRFGVEMPAYRLSDSHGVSALADEFDGASIRRAMMFGCEQISLQHRGLWDLLEARQQARGIY